VDKTAAAIADVMERARTIGRRVGCAIARDVLAEPELLGREWTGLDPLDGERFRSAGLVAGTAAWSLAEEAAEAAYHEVIR
jgi:hypothetical protein